MKNRLNTIYTTLFLCFWMSTSIAQDSTKTASDQTDKPTFEENYDPSIDPWLNKIMEYDTEWSVKQQTAYRALIRVFELKEGALIVRLRSHAKKFKTMENLLNRVDLSIKEKKRLQKNLSKSRAESKATAEAMMESFILKTV